MSGIRGKHTIPELTVRTFLHRAGLRFRLHVKLPGRPDLALARYRTVIFVHGCFWHRHAGCRDAAMPSTNVSFWKKKFADNVQHDARVVRELKGIGWRVIVVWSCQLQERDLAQVVTTIRGSVNMKERSNGRV